MLHGQVADGREPGARDGARLGVFMLHGQVADGREPGARMELGKFGQTGDEQPLGVCPPALRVSM